MSVRALPPRSDERGSDGQLTYEAKAWNQCLEECEPAFEALQAELSRIRNGLLDMIDALSSDAHAASFQSLGQYRSALLKVARPLAAEVKP
ncbi:hypothetical protein [Pseudomonas sp. GTC 16473]|uniref:hypothetical protein n=1 Tax=Pseudomonas sp. GTC 16473 TaxID=1661060 RepID=UPI0008636F4E|nr:hypothetical protein [Pseudomonas sp. GTC 16473]